MKFINRKQELEFLEKKYNTEKPELIVIYGRRRIGKTELIKQFMRDKKAVYHLVSRESEEDQLEEFQESISQEFPELEDIRKEWEILFKKLGEKGKLVVVIDEFQYLIESNSEILKRFQKIWDEYLKNSKLKLILTGSSVGMMETEVLGYKSPLYGRRTGQWNLEPFKFKDALKFFPAYDFEDKIRTYFILGGTPFFLEQFSTEDSLKENILEKILRKGSILREEARVLLQQELRKPKNYFSILKAISKGKTKFGEIMNETGIPRNSFSRYLDRLQRLKLIKRKLPVTASRKSKRGRYEIKDNYFNFWFRFVFPNRTGLEQDPRRVLRAKVVPSLKIYVSHKFEDLCKEAVLEATFDYEVGKWWYQDEEIDITALNEKEGRILLGECKWSKNKVSIGLLKNLKEKAKKVRWKQDKRKETYALFSKSGFTKELKGLSKEKDNLELYDLKRLEKTFS